MMSFWNTLMMTVLEKFNSVNSLYISISLYLFIFHFFSIIYMKQFMKSAVILLIILTSGLYLAAQPPGEDDPKEKERIEALKIAFLTKRLSLTPDEAQKFWPVYNQFTGELETTKNDSKIIRKGMGNEFQSMSDPEVEKFVDEMMAQKRKELEITERYHSQFKKVLPIRKVALLYKSEREFRKQLLSEFKARQGVGVRPGGPGRPGGRP